MTGFGPHGTLPHGVLPDSAAVVTTTATLRYSTHGYTSKPTDTPANIGFDPRIVDGPVFEQSVPLIGTAGRAALGFGDIALWNGDYALTPLLDQYAIDGRSVTLLAGDGTRAYIGTWPAVSTFSTLFAGTSLGWRPDGDLIRIRLRDIVSRLDIPAQAEIYGGTGGIEGTSDHAGKPKPIALGASFNVAPVPLGPVDLGDGLLYTFHVHFRAIQDVTSVRERGAEITRTAAAPGLAEYKVWPSLGVFQLGFTPNGEIKCDIQGDAVPYYLASPSRLVRRLVEDLGTLTLADIDTVAFDTFEYLRPGNTGLWVGAETVTVRALVEYLVGGVGGFATQTRAGLLRIAVLDAPTLVADATLDEVDIQALEPLELPAGLNPPPKRFRVGWKRNWAPSADLAPVVAQDFGATLIEEWRFVQEFVGSVALSHAQAGELTITSAYADAVYAQMEVERLANLYTPARRAFRIVTGAYLGQIELAHTVRFTWPFHGLSAGRNGVVYGWRENRPAGQIELYVYG
jgi:hypothetical protein